MTSEEGYQEALNRIELARRVGAQILDLSSLNLTKIPAELETLENIQTLILKNNSISKIESLPADLKSLNLDKNQILIIEKLPMGLQWLELSNNLINKIEDLSKGLQWLGLNGNCINKLEELPKGIQWLNIKSNQISKIEELPVSLHQLNLQSNFITRIERLPLTLESLNLSNNQIEQIEELPPNLEWLDLSHNWIRRIERIPLKLEMLNLIGNKISIIENLPTTLRYLKLLENPIRNVAPELLENSFSDNCIQAVKAWFTDLKSGSIINRVVRLMVTGNGNVGKSSLIEALQEGKCITDYESTHGIRIKAIQVSNSAESVMMQVFDFGGQEIYSGTHQVFLRGRAVHLIVFDAVTEAVDTVTDRITNESVRNQTLQSWMHILRQASPDSSFILAQNKMDNASLLDSQTKAFVEKSEIDGLAVLKVSAKLGRNISALRGYLLDASRMLPEFGMEMPLSWYKVRQYFLDNVTKEPQHRTHILMGSEFRSLCNTAQVLPLSVSSLLRYLHTSGAVYYDERYLGHIIIADQEWAINAIYKVLDRQSDLYYELRNISFGKCQAKTIFQAFGDSYNESQRWIFISLMESCGLSFPLKEEGYNRSSSQSYYIFPEFLPSDVPEVIAYFLKDATKPQRFFQQKVDFLPYAHVQQFIAHWGLKADIRDVWRTGLRVTTETGQFTFTADLQQHTLTIHAERSLSDEWLNQLLREAAYEGAIWEEVMPSVASQPVRLLAKPSQTDLRDTVQDVVQPQVKRLVISYAEQDKRFVELLVAKLSTRKSLIDVWYDYNISAREDWDIEIMARFADADGYVVFVSDQYMNANKKRYIHDKEIPLMRRRCGLETNQTTTDLFRVVIATTPFSTQYTSLESFPIFQKGKRMPDPTELPNDASQFIEDFLTEMIFPKFLNL